MRSALARVLALVICLGFVAALIADEATVTKHEKGNLTVKVKDKEYKVDVKTVKVKKGDTVLEKKDRGEALKGLKEGDKIDATVKDDKVTEISVK